MEVINILKSARTDFEWFRSNLKELRERFSGEYVAIKNKDIKFHDGDYHKLLIKIRKEKLNPSQFLIKRVER